MDTGTRIKERRLALGLTQAELARAVGYSGGSMITKVEKGLVDLSESKVSVFAKALHTTVPDLMGWSELTGVPRALREEMAAAGVDAAALADRLGKKEADVARLMRDGTSWVFDDVIRFARALDVGPSRLLVYNTGILTPAQNDRVLDGDRVYLRESKNAIPILGRVPAGPEHWVADDVEGWVQFMAPAPGRFFAVRVSGDSMAPTLLDGDLVIVREQAEVSSGDIAVVQVNGFESTCKEVRLRDDGLLLVGHNPAAYTPTFYSAAEVQQLPVVIRGRVVSLRRDF